MNTKSRWIPWILIGLYSIAAILLSLYSYTQIDLSLTLSRSSMWQTIQKWFQHIGYFDRPLSTTLFIGLLVALFILYICSIGAVKKGYLSNRHLWMIITGVVVFTSVAYPAFSYDFFNYLFTAKTVLVYHKNPYVVIPLQFTGVDPWLSFMHWTHLPSAYTPLWILTTLFPYLCGFGYLLLLIFNLKLVIAASYIITIFFIGKILEKEQPKHMLLGMAIFAFNPLIIIECLVSPHNDIPMMALAMISIFLYKNGKRWASWFMLSLSVAMKLMTIFLIPAFALRWKQGVGLVCITLGLIAVLTQRDVLSWYFVWIMPFVALLPDVPALTILSGGISLGLLLRYAPFLYLGNWDPPVPMWENIVSIIPVGISCIIILIIFVAGKARVRRHRIS